MHVALKRPRTKTFGRDALQVMNRSQSIYSLP